MNNSIKNSIYIVAKMNTLNLEEKPSFARMRMFVFFKLGLGFVVSF